MNKVNDKNARTRRWTFTVNNPEVTKEELLKELQERASVRYAIVGHEVGELKGTEHLQGFVEFENAATFEQMKARIPRAHIEPALGSNRQNHGYCTKDNDFVEVGTLVARVQTSQEAQEVCRMIVNDGLSPMAIVIEYPEFSAYIVNHFRALNEMYAEARNVRSEIEAIARMNKGE